MSVISNISIIIGVISGSIALLAAIFSFFTKQGHMLKAVVEGQKALLRDAIEQIYYKNYENKTLREYERKSLDSLFLAYYEGLHGNSFVCDIYKEMREWEIIR